MTLHWEQEIAMNILLKISRNKGDEAMKFGQLIEYNMRNPFLKNQS